MASPSEPRAPEDGDRSGEADHSAAYAAARRVAVGAIGATLVALGAVLLLLPGPGLLVLSLGLAVLAVEFAWARRWLKRLRAAVARRS